MGRKAFFTRDEVFAAAEALAAQGEEVSVRTLHAYLGGGSFSSVMKYLTDWKSTRVTSEAPRTDMPPSVNGFFEAAWKAATAQASKDLALEREKAAQLVDDAEMRVAETIGALEELENKNNELQEKLEAAATKLAVAEASIFKLSNEKTALAASSGEVKDQLKNAQNHLDKLQMSYDQLQKKHSDDINGLQKQHSEEIRKFTMDVAKLEAGRDSAKEEAEKNRERIITAVEESKIAIGKMESKLEIAIADRDLMTKQNAELSGRLDAVERQNKDLLSKIEAKP
jgi:chromosome segregation ATPase